MGPTDVSGTTYDPNARRSMGDNTTAFSNSRYRTSFSEPDEPPPSYDEVVRNNYGVL